MFDTYKDYTKHSQATVNYFTRLAGRNESAAVSITDKSTLKDLKQDFWNKYVTNKVSSVRDYIRLLDESEQHVKKFDVLDNHQSFERILDYLHQEAISKQVKSDPIETLEQFVDANPSQKNIAQILKAIDGSGHQKSIENFV